MKSFSIIFFYRIYNYYTFLNFLSDLFCYLFCLTLFVRFFIFFTYKQHAQPRGRTELILSTAPLHGALSVGLSTQHPRLSFWNSQIGLNSAILVNLFVFKSNWSFPTRPGVLLFGTFFCSHILSNTHKLILFHHPWQYHLPARAPFHMGISSIPPISTDFPRQPFLQFSFPTDSILSFPPPSAVPPPCQGPIHSFLSQPPLVLRGQPFLHSLPSLPHGQGSREGDCECPSSQSVSSPQERILPVARPLKRLVLPARPHV